MSDDDNGRQSVEEMIRQRAYILWERAGRPEGRDAEFWDQATDDITAELLAEQDRIIEDKDAQ